MESSTTQIEYEIQKIGKQIAASFPSKTLHPVRSLNDWGMNYASAETALQTAFFRLIDVAPACASKQELAEHLAGFLNEETTLPPILHTAKKLFDSQGLGQTTVGYTVAQAITYIAHRFIVGGTVTEALPSLQRLWSSGTANTIDLLGEAAITQAEADIYASRCATAIRLAGNEVRGWSQRPLLEVDSLGQIPRAHLSIKITALTPLIRPFAPERAILDAAQRLHRLLRIAYEENVHLHVDTESVDTLPVSSSLFFNLIGGKEFINGPSVGAVVQAYLRDSADQVERILTWTHIQPREYPVTIRLVKGAYWDHEVVLAKQRGWPIPVFEDKSESDYNFEALTTRLLHARLKEGAPVRLAVASHNLRSVAHAIARNRMFGGLDSDLEFQVLHGLGNNLQYALTKNGFRVRVYSPVGDLVSGMAYLIRRLLENTSNESFLVHSRRGESLDNLLRAPLASNSGSADTMKGIQ